LLFAGAAVTVGFVLLLVGLLSAWDFLFYYFWEWLLSPGD
jgi:NADH:ubiquinone oxidoreductase subunit 4 (subunit M)